ncbi:hypothetical protein LYNGBM3L_30950 [Moorena producens 3L]|uniref:Uncharacterized protein n=1 Tax=Moorena producens 3L TaxID=489825 RepID=F4XTR6_9CYAN|nr:hypothetical protein LYNGBM3L_30950 [Moorena producens 3L]
MKLKALIKGVFSILNLRTVRRVGKMILSRIFQRTKGFLPTLQAY